MRKITFIIALIALSIQGIKGPSIPEIPSTMPNYRYTSLSTQGNLPAQEENWSPMVAPLHALVMCMVEREVNYRPYEGEFLWNSLYYMIGMGGSRDWRVTELENRLLVPGEMVADYAYALFGYSENLPEIPEEMKDFVEYDREADVYLWYKGEAGLTETKITKMTPLGENRYQVEGVYVDVVENRVLWEFAGILIENESMFGYQVENFALHHVIAVG